MLYLISSPAERIDSMALFLRPACMNTSTYTKSIYMHVCMHTHTHAHNTHSHRDLTLSFIYSPTPRMNLKILEKEQNVFFEIKRLRILTVSKSLELNKKLLLTNYIFDNNSIKLQLYNFNISFSLLYLLCSTLVKI